MKKTILVVLMVVMVSTPCLAQEVEPYSLFSIEGTQWSAFTLYIFPFPWFRFSEDAIGFYSGKVYTGFFRKEQSFYVDMLVGSIFMYDDTYQMFGEYRDIAFGIVQPIGIGMAISLDYLGSILLTISILLLIKTDDNWIPEETIWRFNPSQGEQGTTLTDVVITCANTTFQDNPPVDEISFDPPDGLTVSNINVISNNEIEFDLEIAVDAPIGERRVIVTYDDGKKSAESGDNSGSFEVREKIN